MVVCWREAALHLESWGAVILKGKVILITQEPDIQHYEWIEHETGTLGTKQMNICRNEQVNKMGVL